MGEALHLDWAGDFVVSQTGGLVMANGWTQASQRIIRRLLTNPSFTLNDGTPVPADYIYHTAYGQGCRRRVGEGYQDDVLTRLRQAIRQGVITDIDVDATKEPAIQFREIAAHTYQLTIGVTLKTQETGVIYLQYAE